VSSLLNFTLIARPAAIASFGLVIPAAWVNMMVNGEFAAIPLSPLVVDDGSISGIVIVTTFPEIVSAPAETSWFPVGEVPVRSLAFNLTAEEAIEDGTVYLVSNLTEIVPPTVSAACVDALVTDTVCSADAPAVVGEFVTVIVPMAALAGLAEKAPKANIVAIAAMTTSAASPKDVPILVFIYSYLLSSCCLKRRMTS
jgi:hypothetical protein